MSGLEIPPALLAQLDQQVAALDSCVDELLKVVGFMLDTGGRTEAIGIVVLSLMASGDQQMLAAIAGTAVVRLAQERRGE